MGRNDDIITSISKYFNFNKAENSQFCNMFIKTTFKNLNQVKLKESKVMYKMKYISVFLDITKMANF